MATHGIFQSPDISLAEEKSQPSVAVRRAVERSRQKTSENRLHLLHLTGFPQVFDSSKPHAVPNSDQFSRSQLLDKLQKASPRESSSASSPRRANNYPSMRTTNQMFDDAMQQAVSHFKFLSPRREAATEKSETKQDPEYQEMLEARKMPFDCVVRSARGLITTIYREDFCKNPPQESFRTQTLPREEAAPVESPKKLCAVEANQRSEIHNSIAPEATSSAAFPETQPQKVKRLSATAKRCQIATSPRATVYTASPRRHIPPPVVNGEYVAVTRSYFTERGEHLRDLPPSTQNSMPW